METEWKTAREARARAARRDSREFTATEPAFTGHRATSTSSHSRGDLRTNPEGLSSSKSPVSCAAGRGVLEWSPRRSRIRRVLRRLHKLPRAAQRLDRKALKQDALLQVTARVTDYVSENSNMVLGIAAGAAVVVVLLVFFARGQTHKVKESDVQFSQV